MSGTRMQADPAAAARDGAVILWLLLGAFVLRVIAQPLALVVDQVGLPPFGAWHSGVVPYWLLLLAQLAIIAALLRVALRFSRGQVVPRRSIGRVLLPLAVLYAGAMLLRLALGLTVLSGHYWFSAYLPTMFHLVLASFLFCVGRFHLRYSHKE